MVSVVRYTAVIETVCGVGLKYMDVAPTTAQKGGLAPPLLPRP